MLRLATSGLSVAAGIARSSTRMVGAPPEVRLITTLARCLMRGTNFMNASGDWSGRPVSGLRACRCTIAAPASAAPIADSAIWSGVIGRCGDMLGVWIEPVIAQVMMTLFFAMWCQVPVERPAVTPTRGAPGGGILRRRIGVDYPAVRAGRPEPGRK